MSQAKVDRYKEYKSNKKENIKKEKRTRRLEYGVAILLLVAFLGWIGYAFVVDGIDRAENGEASYTEINVTELNNYLSNLGVAE